MVLFELLGPVIELAGYLGMTLLWLLHMISLTTFLVFLFLSFGMGVLLTTNSILLERLSFQMYPRVGQQITLFIAGVIENFGYRQLTAVFRIIGLFRWIASGKARSDWGTVRRNATWQAAGASGAATTADPSRRDPGGRP
jgi:hypothetical protein